MNDHDTAMISAATLCGFVTEVRNRTYQVPFATLGPKRTEHTPPSAALVPADQVDPDALFRLDERLRRDVPGLDRWIGRRDWFDDEMASAEFDPSGYLVAHDATSDQLVGLVRFWRHPDMPALGLLGVLPDFRNRFLSYELLIAGATGAHLWGHPCFTTQTARQSLWRRLERIGAHHTETFLQMVTRD